MITYYKRANDAITAKMEWWSSDNLPSSEGYEQMDAADIIAYAEAVPSWDYLDEGMFDYVAYWCDLDQADFYNDNGDFDFEAFWEAAKKYIG